MITRNRNAAIVVLSYSAMLLTFAPLFADESDAHPNGESVIARIDQVTDDQYEIVDFTLQENRILRIVATGEWNTEASEGFRMVMGDYGGIENAETGQLIWEMHRFSTKPAGGSPRNRQVDRLLPLSSGTYRLHFRSNGSHSFDHWIDDPPDPPTWGITLFDVTESHQEMLDDFWERAETPESLGWSTDRLRALEPLLDELGSSALLIVTDDKIVFEWGNTANNFRSHSTRKQLFSGLFGIYVENGMIDLSKTMKELDIRETSPLTEEEQQATVLDLLQSRSGVYLPAAAESPGMKRMRPERGSHKPGTFWMYNNWDFNVLGTIFRQETGEDIYEAFDRRIAGPIGMQDYILEDQGYGKQDLSIHSSYPFRISARDMARYGRLFLHDGRWNGEQIIPLAWKEASIRSYSNSIIKGAGFGYLWWVLTHDTLGMKKGSYFASGFAGQKIFILPDKESVIVHRINITEPGINWDTAAVVPLYLMPRIMRAYTGQKMLAAQKPAPANREVKPQRPLLVDYENVRQAEGVYFKRSRILIGGCLIVFLAYLIFHPARAIARKMKGTRAKKERHWLSATAKGAAVTNGALCSPYAVALLNNGRVLEEFSVYELKGNLLNLSLPAYFLSQIPTIAIVTTGLVAIFCVVSWVRKLWGLPERILFTCLLISSMIFIWVTKNTLMIG